MRFLIILTTLAMLPVFVGFHAYQFSRRHESELQVAALDILRQQGIRAPTAELRFLDLRVSGAAPDAAALDRATSALKDLRPTRLISNELSVPAALQAKVHGQVLHLEGWLSNPQEVSSVVDRLAALRPDLKIDTARLHRSPHVRWPEGISEPLAEDGPLLAPILDKLRVPPALHITAADEIFRVTGALPSVEVRDSITNVLRTVSGGRSVEAGDVRVSPHMIQATFTEKGVLEPFLRSFFGTLTPATFSVTLTEGPRLQAAATPSLESEWLNLLRQISGGTRVEMQLTLYPSIYHFPGYKPTTPLPADTLESLRRIVSDFYIAFKPGSAALSPEAEARLSSLASSLLSAGPALRLIVGGHPDPRGNTAVERRLALERAEQVRSVLIEQGAPAAEIEAIAFDPMPSGASGAPLQAQSVEILVK